MLHFKIFSLLSFLLISVGESSSHAYSVNGRLTLGTYQGAEHLSTQVFQQGGENDINILSGRFYLRFADVSDNRFQFTTDIRDKNDFFGTVNPQQFDLVNANTFQFRELSAKYPGKTFFTQVGRFPVNEGGAIFTDGLLQGATLSPTLRCAVFGGYNPKRPDQYYVQWNGDSQVYGTYLTYIPAFLPWGSSLYFDTAGVGEIVQGNPDRVYWFNNAVFQWDPRSRLSLLAYLDFKPNTYLQSGTFNYEQALGPKLTSSLTYMAIDVLEWLRLRSVLTQLSSSPYKEGSAKLRYNAGTNWSLEASYANGYRAYDGLVRQEISLGSNFLKAFGKHWDFSVYGGYRDNFVSLDDFGNAHLGYFSDLWELGLDEEFGVQYYKTGFGTYHPLISEFSVSREIENALYGTFTYQDVHDERVQITTIFLKVSYRFGNREIPPIRDGAPPKGRL